MAVNSITGRNLKLQRGGRLLLSIPHIELTAQPSGSRCTVIVGPNGAGKSVLVRCLCGLLKPDAGTVTWDGSAPDAGRRRRVGLILQKPVLLRRSALANIVYALRQAGIDRKTARARAAAALEQAGLANITQVLAHRLSGGEQQRLALARALLLEPDILFLDEVTANVDPSSTLMIEQQLRAALLNGLSVVMVSHDQGQVRRLADHIILMHNGEIVESASATEFFNQPRSRLSRHWIAGELLV